MDDSHRRHHRWSCEQTREVDRPVIEQDGRDDDGESRQTEQFGQESVADRRHEAGGEQRPGAQLPGAGDQQIEGELLMYRDQHH